MAGVTIIGAGALSLGLLAPTFAAAGLEVTIASRVATSREQQRLSDLTRRREVHIAFLGGGAFHRVPLARTIDISQAAGLDQLDEVLQNPATSAVVTAARSGFNEVAELVVHASSERGSPLLVICADNQPPDGWVDLVRSSPRNVETVPSIADRICVRFPRTQPTADVVVEEYSLWTIATDSAGRSASWFGDIENVEVTGDINRAIRRKLHLVNGLQLALAIMAWVDGDPLLDRWISENQAFAEELMESVAASYQSLTGDPSAEVRGFAQMNLHRFGETPDRSGRMLGLAEGDVVGDPADLQERLAARVLPLLANADWGPLSLVADKGLGLVEQWNESNWENRRT